jgi:hypothetical protein
MMKGSDAYVRRAMPALESLACNFSARLSTALLNIDAMLPWDGHGDSVCLLHILEGSLLADQPADHDLDEHS